ncbi:MAG TPA: DUF4325 domain-containing protein [Tepidisphaeraceae bacterium]|jgi:anti-sigma regulatory factor (Ser/Thr protein kinase)|nr:DUF4325 domain-containing protein [Tepidisphaeraceae bacterium]
MGVKGEQIRSFILSQVREHPGTITNLVVEEFEVSRQAVHRHLRELVNLGVLAGRGVTRGRMYHLVETDRAEVALAITLGLNEDEVWQAQVADRARDVPHNVYNICFHGFTEMVNNAKDHSEGTEVRIRFVRTAADITIWIVDNGVGIFKKITRAMNLPDPRQAMIELAKGKFTTDPDHHSGEGIFFTSRACDEFEIRSGDLSFVHNSKDDWLLKRMETEQPGTEIMMRVSLMAKRTLKEIFDMFAAPEEFAFNKTHVPMKLAKFGEANLISRSQAKRVLERVDRFAEVILDFDGVEMIGQGFADEMFRVFVRSNPGVKLLAINTNKSVDQMIRRAQGHDVKRETNGK